MTWIRHGWSWVLGYREVPFSVRGLVRRELGHMMFWGVVWGTLNGRYCGFIAARSLNAPDPLVGLVVSSIAIANLFAIWWASLAARRPIRRLLIPGIVCLAGVLFSFAATPLCRSLDPWSTPGGSDPPSAWTLTAIVFAVQVMVGWIIIQGINTVRTRMWRLNYPASHRGRIMARFGIWQIVVAVITSALIGSFLDGRVRIPFGTGSGYEWDLSWLPGAGSTDGYGLLFPIAGVFALISAWFYRGIAVRREPHALAEHARTQSQPMPHALEASFNLPGWFQTLRAGVFVGLGEARNLLRDDPRFRRYMSWQMLAGSGTMIMEVPIILILNERFQVSYVAAAALLTIVPQIVLIACTPVWARLFDRWPLMRFRIVQMSVWIVSRIVLGIGIWTRSLLLVGAALGIGGLALGGGKFSWQLGHMAFSQRHNDATYMGVHQALTGVRGLITPFLGAALYRFVLGWHVVWLAGALQAASVFGFARLNRSDPTGVRNAASSQDQPGQSSADAENN